MNHKQVLEEYGLQIEHVAMLEVMRKVPNVSSKMLRARAKIPQEHLEKYIQDLEERELASRFTLVKKANHWIDSIELTEKGTAVLQKYLNSIDKLSPDDKSPL